MWQQVEFLQQVWQLHPRFLDTCMSLCRLSFRHRGGFGTIAPLAPDSQCTSGLHAVHGVAYLVSAADLGKLTGMEHEYLPVEMPVRPSELPSCSVRQQCAGGVWAGMGTTGSLCLRRPH
jgi:hypothetical protein